MKKISKNYGSFFIKSVICSINGSETLLLVNILAHGFKKIDLKFLKEANKNDTKTQIINLLVIVLAICICLIKIETFEVF